MDSEDGVHEPDTYDGTVQTPFRLQEILPDKVWPDNLVQFLKNPTGSEQGGERRMKLTELTALLCHVGLVEVGFLPTHIKAENFEEIWYMTDWERIQRFALAVDPKGYQANGAAYSWSYCAMEFAQQDVERGVAMAGKYRLKLSAPLSVMILPEDSGKVKIYGNFNDKETGKMFHHCRDVALSAASVLKSQPSFHTMNLTLSEWMANLKLSGARFSATFKKDFAFLCMDSMEGISFEKKNVELLSTEILAHIFSYCDVKTVRSARLACKKFNEVGYVPQLWLFLLNRDFGPLPLLGQKFAQMTQRRPTTMTLSDNLSDPAHDYSVLYTLEKISRPNRSYSMGRIPRVLYHMPVLVPPPSRPPPSRPNLIIPHIPFAQGGPAVPPHYLGPLYPGFRGRQWL